MYYRKRILKEVTFIMLFIGRGSDEIKFKGSHEESCPGVSHNSQKGMGC
jgi:hypothetical protein